MFALVIIGIVPAILGALSGFKAEGRRIAQNKTQTPAQAVARTVECIVVAVLSYWDVVAAIGFLALAALGDDSRLLLVSAGAALVTLYLFYRLGRTLTALLRGLHHSQTSGSQPSGN